MEKILKDRDADVDNEAVASGRHLARVEEAEEETARRLRLIVVRFDIIRGRFRGKSLQGRFVFNENWRPAGNARAGDGLGDFMHELGKRLNWETEGPEKEVAASDLVGAVGLIDVGVGRGHRAPEVHDFFEVRLAPKVYLHQWRVQNGVAVDAELVETRRPGVGTCPGCLQEVKPEITCCPNCEFDQQEFWTEHCPRCLIEVDDAELHCSLCGAALVDTEDAEAEHHSGPMVGTTGRSKDDGPGQGPVVTAPVVQESKSTSDVRRCHKCGDELEDGVLEICVGCETGITEGQEP